MVWQFIEIFKKVADSTRVQDDDFSDRLNHRWTAALLLLFCILVGSSQFVGNPIACWVPAQFTNSMTTYSNYICWIASTYYVPINKSLPMPVTPRTKINYYQWVPFILALMALLFYLPFSVWHLLSKPSGLDVKTVMNVLKNTQDSSKSIENATRIIDKAIEFRRENVNTSRFRRIISCIIPSNRSGFYISWSYILVKLLYVTNVCGQFFLLNIFLGPRFNLYGFQVIDDLIKGRDFWESPRFPRVTMCDFNIRNMGENNHRNTIQCTLPINLFNEKIFIFLWFWMCFVATCSVYTLISWSCAHLRASRVNFIKHYIPNGELSNQKFNNFIFSYLKSDGVFMLRLIKKNTNDILVGELISALWCNFKHAYIHEEIV